MFHEQELYIITWVGKVLFMAHPVINQNLGEKVVIDSQPMLNFTSNDYLGMADNKELKKNIKEAIDKHGLGSTGSRRLSGNHSLFLNTEASISSWVGKEAGVLLILVIK